MVTYQQKRKIQRFLYSPFVLGPLMVVVFLLGSSVWSVYTKERNTWEKREKEAARLEKLNARAAALEAEIEKLSTQRGKEAEIRSKFEVAKDGENVIVIVDPEKETPPPPPPPEPSFWQRLIPWL